MALFGDVFTAEQAARVGLVDAVVETGDGTPTAQELAEKLRHRGPVAIELTKMLLNAAEGEEQERVLEALAGRIAAADPQLKVGLAAFKSKSKAEYWPKTSSET